LSNPSGNPELVPDPRWTKGQNRVLKKYQLDQMWTDSRLPRRHLQAPDDLSWPNNVDRTCWEILMAPGIVALVGPRGTGKTQIAVSLAKRMMAECERSVLYLKVCDYFGLLKSEFGGGREATTQSIRSTAHTKHLLVLDEVQERVHSDFEDREFVNMIDHRYAALKPTILISNQTVKGFADSVGASVMSRLSENGAIVACDWPSFRAAAVPSKPRVGSDAMASNVPQGEGGSNL